MKKLAIALIVLVSALTAFAQSPAGTDDDVTRRIGDRNLDVPIVYETTDPAGNQVKVVIDPPTRNPIYNPADDPDSPYFRGWEVDEFEKYGQDAMKASVTVDVYAVADEEYRAAHSNWQNLLNQIIETADNAYWRDHQINWVIAGYYSWTSNGSNASAILSDLANDGSSLPNGLCMGFSDDSNFDAGGIAYVYNSNPGLGFSVCLDQGTSSTTYALRHEIGHNYGCSHDFGSTVCMMNYTYSYSVDYFDSAHKSLVNARQGWFQ